MVRVTIDGREVEVAAGTNLVEAAAALGIDIPTYCYHPGLTIVGQCRICFVEVEGMPRLVTACSTPAQDGMRVNTTSERVRESRAAVMEFLLANHPLDCPVCDQAGECLLQDYSVAHGLDTTHMVDERRTFPGLERRLIGPHVVQNQNRCIHCTRCIRFTQEISETWDLTMKSRGNHSFIDTANGEPFVNPWSACVADVCPVGALTVKEFRFRARVWHLEETPSICPGCSIGCNVTVGHLNSVVHRFVPRANPEVNGWWMCDYGRFLAESLNDRSVETPALRAENSLVAVGWAPAIEKVAEILRGRHAVQVIASANLSNEALFLASRLLAADLGLEVVVPVETGEPRAVKDGARRWVRSEDAHPNSLGARLIGLETVDRPRLETFLRSGEGPLLLLDEHAHPWLATPEAAAALATRPMILIARTETPLLQHASVVLPAASWIEAEGTFTSSTGRVQLAQRGLYPAAQAKSVWEILSLLAVRLGYADRRAGSAREVFERLVAEVPAFAGMTFRRLAVEPGVPVLAEVPHVR